MEGFDEEDQDHVGYEEGAETQVIGRIRMLSQIDVTVRQII